MTIRSHVLGAFQAQALFKLFSQLLGEGRDSATTILVRIFLDC